MVVVRILLILVGTAIIVVGAELFAEHLASASQRLGVSSFALALLLAGAEPEELATVVTASGRGVDGVAFGDVIGANASIVTLALAAAAAFVVVPMGPRIRRYAFGGLAAGLLATVMLWDGSVGRVAGGALVLAYVAFVAVIWRAERRPPSLGEVGELDEDHEGGGRVGKELFLVVAGVALLTAGSILVVESVRRLTSSELNQTRLGLTVVGLATSAELIVLAYSTAKRGITEAAIAGIVGSYAYNMTMSLGAGAVVAPIRVADATALRAPAVVTVLLLGGVVAWTARHPTLGRRSVPVLLLGYAGFVAASLV